MSRARPLNQKGHLRRPTFHHLSCHAMARHGSIPGVGKVNLEAKIYQNNPSAVPSSTRNDVESRVPGSCPTPRGPPILEILPAIPAWPWPTLARAERKEGGREDDGRVCTTLPGQISQQPKILPYRAPRGGLVSGSGRPATLHGEFCCATHRTVCVRGRWRRRAGATGKRARRAEGRTGGTVVISR
jgi:hypothetical protein